MSATRFVRVFGAVVAIAVAGGLAGCGSSASSGAASSPPAGSSSAALGAVTIVNFSFMPQSLTVRAGTTVTWTNSDSTTHTTTADDGAWDSGNLQAGKRFTFTFSSAGTFKYHCNIHNYMTGTITVSGS